MGLLHLVVLELTVLRHVHLVFDLGHPTLHVLHVGFGRGLGCNLDSSWRLQGASALILLVTL